MTSEHVKSNLTSWNNTLDFINEFEGLQMLEWKKLASKFIHYGMDHNFNRYFRAGLSMHTLVFSTLDHTGLNYEPRVNVSLLPPEFLRLYYIPNLPAPKGDEQLEYELVYSDALPTFQRFLNHLWCMTRSEPLPSDMRSPDNKFTAPILSEDQKIASHWLDWF